MFSVSGEAARGIGRIEATCLAIDEEMRIMKPLMIHLIEMRQKMDENAISLEDRTAELRKDQFPEQYKKGINRCVGIDIHWVGNNAST